MSLTITINKKLLKTEHELYYINAVTDKKRMQYLVCSFICSK